MTTTATPNKAENTKVNPADNLKGIENHKKAAMHHEQASKQHIEAAKNYEEGNHEKAAKNAITAQGHSILANEANKEVAKNHALTK